MYLLVHRAPSTVDESIPCILNYTSLSSRASAHPRIPAAPPVHARPLARRPPPTQPSPFVHRKNKKQKQTMDDSPTINATSILDEQRYRSEVLHFDSAEAEQARAQQLIDDARTLGLKVPEIEASAPLAASIASGMVDLSSPVLSSGSSTGRNSLADGSVTPSYETVSPSPLDQVVSSPSEITIGSERAKPGSTRSLASLSTRPTSYCSSESRNLPGAYGNNADGLSVAANRMSLLSVASADKKEKRRSSLKNAIGRIHFRKKRPSSVLLPPHSQVLISKGETGVEHVFLEQKKDPPTSNNVISRPATTESLAKLEIPLFDKASLQRSLDDPELAEMLERHRMERNRHMAFQDAALSIVRQRHQNAISERYSENERLEEEKREKVRKVDPFVFINCSKSD